MAVDIALDTDFMTNFEVTLTVFNNIIGWRIERFFFLHTNGTLKSCFRTGLYNFAVAINFAGKSILVNDIKLDTDFKNKIGVTLHVQNKLFGIHAER